MKNVLIKSLLLTGVAISACAVRVNAQVDYRFSVPNGDPLGMLSHTADVSASGIVSFVPDGTKTKAIVGINNTSGVSSTIAGIYVLTPNFSGVSDLFPELDMDISLSSVKVDSADVTGNWDSSGIFDDREAETLSDYFGLAGIYYQVQYFGAFDGGIGIKKGSNGTLEFTFDQGYSTSNLDGGGSGTYFNTADGDPTDAAPGWPHIFVRFEGLELDEHRGVACLNPDCFCHLQVDKSVTGIGYFSVVPEPGAYAAFALLTLAGLLVLGRRFRNMAGPASAAEDLESSN